MKTREQKTMLAESAIFLLREGILTDNKQKILSAYDIIESDETFNWDGLDVIYMEWEELVDQGNEILNDENL